MLNLWGGYRMFARTLFLTASIAATSAMPAAASAEVLKFHVALDGHYGPEPTGSPSRHPGQATSAASRTFSGKIWIMMLFLVLTTGEF